MTNATVSTDELAADYWSTGIVDIAPGSIRMRGYPIEQLIGKISFPEMIWHAELGFAPPLARGIFCLSRSVGILAHAWEQSRRGERNKGPMPRQMPYRYTGPPARDVDR